jgi:hypothetical protein
MKYFLILLSGLLFFKPLYAITDHTCPTVDDIRQQAFGLWLPLYIDNGELASKIDVERFKKAVTKFVRAEWSPDYLEAGHCFYAGNDPIIDQITFASDTLTPKFSYYPPWRLLQPPPAPLKKLAVCYLSEQECPYSGHG